MFRLSPSTNGGALCLTSLTVLKEREGENERELTKQRTGAEIPGIKKETEKEGERGEKKLESTLLKTVTVLRNTEAVEHKIWCLK